MSARPSAAEPSRRAPRLAPDEHIGAHMSRRGRFAKIDPLKPRPLPAWPNVVGVLGWVGLVGGTLYKAWAATREQDGEPT